MRHGFRVLGLTGGIGTGKSTVARMFAARGVPVVDADALAREVVAPGTVGNAEIAAVWPQVIAPDGAVDRKRLGAIVFADPAARARLESITHPLIQEASASRLADLAAEGHPLALYEAALLVESGRWRDFDGLIVVTASPENQVARAVARGGLTPEEAAARIAAQAPAAEKLRLATYVIDNDGSREETEAQVRGVIEKLR
ncbi:MAG TPA: dephospho-CoA kinase [Polyangia bacterium]|nr:dephospho-CoA kinase [Polyangia bacterium]